MSERADFIHFIMKLQREVAHADQEHGNWHGETHKQKLEHLEDEVDELSQAVEKKDVNSEHGMKRESIQIACTAYKFWRSLK